ncbi:MAG: multicopper oxidase domain-containing protein [Ilumatobacteraceae bacterium]
MNVRLITRVFAAAVLTVSLAACADDGPNARLGAAAGAGAGAGAAEAGVLSPGSIVEFHASEFAFAPMELTAEPGTYTGHLINDGTLDHDITFGDGDSFVASPGETVEFEFVVPEGGIDFLCSVPGHSDAGMTGVVRTPGSATPVAAAGPSSDGVADEVAADPDAPPYEWRDPTVPARGEGDGVTLVPGGADGGGDLIEVEMVVEEKLMTVAEGYQQLVWTFNGTVPGPVLRTQVGDTVRVHLVNPAGNSASHSVDFHASQVAWNDEMRSIAPGEDLVYEFTADYAGVWMYHCGTDPVLHHIANGMFGIVIVEPEGGLPPIDNEFFLVQNEWYLGPQGEVSSYAKANQATPAPDFVMFNGVAFQYKDHPIEVPTGEPVRLFVFDAGPSIDSSFHIVGTIFHDVIKEGIHLVAGNDGNWGAQAVDLAPAQGAIIELTAAEDGLYPIVTHAFNFPGRGALGLLQAGDGEP